MLSQHIQSEEIEDDEVIVLEGDNDDNFSQNMLKYFKDKNYPDKKNMPGLVSNKVPDKPADDLEGVCRICLGEEDDPQNNPLFSPCMCAGSMGLIHL